MGVAHPYVGGMWVHEWFWDLNLIIYYFFLNEFLCIIVCIIVWIDVFYFLIKAQCQLYKLYKFEYEHENNLNTK